MGEMAENLGKSSNSIYYNSMASIYTQEVKLNSETCVVKCMREAPKLCEIFQEMITGSYTTVCFSAQDRSTKPAFILLPLC